ncbi:hypothetical protein GIX45_16195 [Erwinia sp. CPCC 100877]|nr:hypothetical protein [Erwinia sp. CPCC 100877]
MTEGDASVTAVYTCVEREAKVFFTFVLHSSLFEKEFMCEKAYHLSKRRLSKEQSQGNSVEGVR